MADALTGRAFYSALSEHVYWRANVKDKADQSLTLKEDGNQLGAEPSIAGQELVDPKLVLKLNMNSLTASRSRIDKNYIYNTALGFVAMVTQGTDGKYAVTFRSTHAGDPSFWTFSTATLFNA